MNSNVLNGMNFFADIKCIFDSLFEQKKISLLY